MKIEYTAIASEWHNSTMLARSYSSRCFLLQCPRFPSRPRSAKGIFSNARRSAAVKPPSQPRLSARASTSQSSEVESSLKFAGRRSEGFGKLERKVAKQGTVVLFKAPSFRGYVLGAYGIAAFCFAYSVYNSYIVFQDPIFPLPAWQKTLYGGICVMMSAMGTVFIFRTGRLIKAVTAVQSNGNTYLHFKVRRMIPFMRPMEFDVLPRQIAFSRRLVVAPEHIVGNGITAGSKTTASPTVTPEDISFFKAPLTKINFNLWKFFRSMRQLFTSEDFIFLDVEGHKGSFRMDSKGYISEELLVLGDPRSARYSSAR